MRPEPVPAEPVLPEPLPVERVLPEAVRPEPVVAEAVLPEPALAEPALPDPEAPAAAVSPPVEPTIPELNAASAESGPIPADSAAPWSVAAFSSSELSATTTAPATQPVDTLTSSALPESTLVGWYLERDGTPLGPLDEAALRAQAEAGVLQDDTLVWREELEDWKDALHYPVLGRLIAEARNRAPIAMAAVPPTATPIAAAPPNAAPPTGGVPAVPALPPTLLGSVGEFGPIAPARISVAAPSSRLSWQAEAAAPGFSAAILAAAIFVSLAVGFGAGYVTFGNDTRPTANAPAAPELPAGNGLAQGAAPPPPPPAPLVNSAAAPEPGGQGRVDKKSGSRKDTSSAEGSRVEGDTNASTAGGGLLAGLGADQTGGGPQANAAGGGRGGSGPSLDANQIQSAVQRNQPSVRRNCWQRALSSAAGAPAGARVTVTIKIAPNGSVTSVNHSGEAAGYPGLAGCIAARVKEWSFPKSGGPTTAEVPFVFAAQ